MAYKWVGECRKQKKDLAKLKAPPEYSLAVDFKKVVLTPINTWVVKRVKELLKGLEDEVLVGTIVETLKQVRTCQLRRTLPRAVHCQCLDLYVLCHLLHTPL